MSKNLSFLFIALILPALTLSCKGEASSETPEAAIPAAQTTGEIRYVFARSGLNLREAPSADAAVTATAPYGAQLAVLEDDAAPVPMQFEGLKGHWLKVQHGDVSGYVFNGLLGRRPAPRADEEYQAYIHRVYGPVQSETKHKSPETITVNEDDTWRAEYVLQNGARQESAGYYAGSFHTYTLPGTDIQEAFLAARLCDDYYFLKLKQFPRKSHRFDDQEDFMGSFTVSVETRGDAVSSFKAEFEYWEISIEQDGTGVILKSGGGT